MSDTVIAMLFGILGSVSFHISKGMQRHGIDVFDTFLYRRNHKVYSDGTLVQYKKPTIYIAGLILNNSVIIWVMCANLFAPTSYFTSMFGTGLIALMLYSRIFLKEPISGNEYIGIFIVIGGTVILGIEGIFRKTLDMSLINIEPIVIFGLTFIPVIIILFIISLKSSKVYFIGVAAGVFTGTCASMNPLFKGIAQNFDGAARLIPISFEGWIFFVISFIFASSSFIFTQFGFYKKTRASVQIPIQNSIYIVLPLVLQAIALPEFGLTFITLIGMGIVILGMIFMHIEKFSCQRIFTNIK